MLKLVIKPFLIQGGVGSDLVYFPRLDGSFQTYSQQPLVCCSCLRRESSCSLLYISNVSVESQCQMVSYISYPSTSQLFHDIIAFQHMIGNTWPTCYHCFQIAYTVFASTINIRINMCFSPRQKQNNVAVELRPYPLMIPYYPPNSIWSHESKAWYPKRYPNSSCLVDVWLVLTGTFFPFSWEWNNHPN